MDADEVLQNITTGASLVSPTSSGGNEAIHKGNMSSELDASTVGGKTPGALDRTLDSGITHNLDINDFGLVHWYPMVRGSGSEISDFSNHGLDANISGATWTGGPSGGNALHFEPNDYAYSGVNTPITGRSPRTVCFWAKTPKDSTWYNNNEQWAAWVDFPEREVDQGSFMVVPYSSEVGGNVALHFWSSNCSAGQTIESFGLNTWHFFAGRMTGQGFQDIYVNGTVEGTSSFTPDTPAGPLQIGRRHYSGNYYCFGDIADVRVYNRYLSDAELNEIMNGNA